MSLEKESDNTLKNFEGAIEISKIKMRKYLMEMTKEDRFRVLREDFSLKGIETMCEWALPEEDYEICASVKEVMGNNIDKFEINFSFHGEPNNKASVVKFKGTDGNTYYHADYILHDSEEGTVVMLYKNEKGNWISEWKSNNPIMCSPIGEAIALFELS